MAQRRLDRSIVALKDEHKYFIRDGIDDREETEIRHRFFWRLFLRIQVKTNTIWIIYRDGLEYGKLGPGPHILWRSPFSRWQVHRISQQIIELPFLVEGRVKGPRLSAGDERVGPEQELACNVQAKLNVACRITNHAFFLQHEAPIKFVYSLANNIVNEVLGKLDYDQFGDWTSRLRDTLQHRLARGGNDDAEHLLGLEVLKVTTNIVVHDDLYSQEMARMFQLVEQGKRELQAASTARQQGSLLKLAPSILLLRDHEIGRLLIERDADLRKLMIAAGIYPAVQQPIVPGHLPTGALDHQYIQPPDTPMQLPASVPGAVLLSPPPQSPAGPGVRIIPEEPAVSQPHLTESPFTAQRKAAELERLRQDGFTNGSWGSQAVLYGADGRPDRVEWTLDVYVRQTTGYLTFQFRCSQEYPLQAPEVWVRPAGGGGFGRTEPNTVVNWQPGCMLADVVREIAENTPE